MRINAPAHYPSPKTHEGAPAVRLNAEKQLRRSVMACMLFEGEFYEDGQSIAKRIADMIPKVSPEIVAEIAVDAREKSKLRHVPLLIAREMARLPTHKREVSSLLPSIIQRADELAEFLAIYWKDGKQPLSAQVKRGLAAAFGKFSEYDLAKYNRDGAVKLRDVLFLSHAKPKNDAQAALWKKLVDGTLATPDTWEVALSAGADKKDSFTRLMAEKKLGAMAFLRNLRNMTTAGIKADALRDYASTLKVDRVLPFRFIAAARAVPQLEPVLEPLMLRCLESQPKLPGKTVLLIDTSPSMAAQLSEKSDLTRMDAAFGLAILCRELCDDVEIWAFSNECKIAPPRRGFALADGIKHTVQSNGTQLGLAVRTVSGRYDRLICLTDEQSQDAPSPPDKGKTCYLINVASARNGIGYAGSWTHLDGFSEALIEYMHLAEVAP